MRAVVLTLALVTSPLGAAVCEVVCADHVTAGHHGTPAPEAVVTEHQHHEHMAPVADAPASAGITGPSTQAASALRSPDADCAPPFSQPAMLRSAVTPRAGAVSPLLAVATAGSLDFVRPHTGGPPVWSSPPPPLLARIPLRI